MSMQTMVRWQEVVLRHNHDFRVITVQKVIGPCISLPSSMGLAAVALYFVC
jgi:hypothetical protein